MKLWICLLLVMVPLCAAERPSTAKSGEVKRANRAQARPPATGIPAGAVETSPGNWHYTDAQGKAWIYRKTPFGISRVEDKPAAPAPDAKTAQLEEADLKSIQATEDGETVHFERKGPFGVYKWSKPKKDLNELEQAALNSIEATEDGEMVRFERKGPFGVYKWSKPKKDLDEIERKAWESGQKKTAAPAGDKQE